MTGGRRIQINIPILIHENRRETDTMLKKFMESGKCVLGKCFDLKRNS